MPKTPPHQQISIRDVRRLREVAADLVATAWWHREHLIEQLGLERYVHTALGDAAHVPADGCRIEWAERVERINGARARLGETVCTRARRERRLPKAVVDTNGARYYL